MPVPAIADRRLRALIRLRPIVCCAGPLRMRLDMNLQKMRSAVCILSPAEYPCQIDLNRREHTLLCNNLPIIHQYLKFIINSLCNKEKLLSL